MPLYRSLERRGWWLVAGGWWRARCLPLATHQTCYLLTFQTITLISVINFLLQKVTFTFLSLYGDLIFLVLLFALGTTHYLFVHAFLCIYIFVFCFIKPFLRFDITHHTRLLFVLLRCNVSNSCLIVFLKKTVCIFIARKSCTFFNWTVIPYHHCCFDVSAKRFAY